MRAQFIRTCGDTIVGVFDSQKGIKESVRLKGKKRSDPAWTLTRGLGVCTILVSEPRKIFFAFCSKEGREILSHAIKKKRQADGNA
jgi:hypothetical protein